MNEFIFRRGHFLMNDFVSFFFFNIHSLDGLFPIIMPRDDENVDECWRKRVDRILTKLFFPILERGESP